MSYNILSYNILEYNQAIAGEYGAGSRGVCVVHNNSQHTCIQ